MVFPESDGAHYPIGNGLNLATSTGILVIGALTWWVKRDNRKREGRPAEEELAGMSQAQIQDLD